MANLAYFLVSIIMLLCVDGRIINKRKCPEVRAVPHFDLPQEAFITVTTIEPEKQNITTLFPACPGIETFKGDCYISDHCSMGFGQSLHNPCPERFQKMLGDWYVVEYYASAEEALSYSCMKAVLTEDDHVQTADGSVEWTPGVTMNFTYRFADDPLGENLLGNITWRVDLNEPAHWTHAESTYDGIYNTYVLDTEYKTWALLLHCAEQREGARYLSAFVLSRKTSLPKNVMAYLRDKLPRYDVDVKYVFPISHNDCSSKPASFDYSPILVEVGSKVPKRPGISYKVAFGH